MTSRCPDCGFSYAWDGERCNHCHPDPRRRGARRGNDVVAREALPRPFWQRAAFVLLICLVGPPLLLLSFILGALTEAIRASSVAVSWIWDRPGDDASS